MTQSTTEKTPETLVERLQHAKANLVINSQRLSAIAYAFQALAVVGQIQTLSPEDRDAALDLIDEVYDNDLAEMLRNNPDLWPMGVAGTIFITEVHNGMRISQSGAASDAVPRTYKNSTPDVVTESVDKAITAITIQLRIRELFHEEKAGQMWAIIDLMVKSPAQLDSIYQRVVQETRSHKSKPEPAATVDYNLLSVQELFDLLNQTKDADQYVKIETAIARKQSSE